MPECPLKLPTILIARDSRLGATLGLVLDDTPLPLLVVKGWGELLMVAERLDGRRSDAISSGLGIGPIRSGGTAELMCDVSDIGKWREGDAIDGRGNDETSC